MAARLSRVVCPCVMMKIQTCKMRGRSDDRAFPDLAFFFFTEHDPTLIVRFRCVFHLYEYLCFNRDRRRER